MSCCPQFFGLIIKREKLFKSEEVVLSTNISDFGTFKRKLCTVLCVSLKKEKKRKFLKSWCGEDRANLAYLSREHSALLIHQSKCSRATATAFTR